MLYKDTWVWYLPSDFAAHATALRESGCTRAIVKAGGDGGNVWEQWGPRVGAYEGYGIEPVPWHYVLPYNDDEDEALVATLRKRWAPEIILNPEIEWWGVAREYVLAWVNSLRARLRAEFGRSPLIGFSSVATWAQFPYEAWSEACDGTEQPQVYWRLFRADQVRALNQRARRGATIVPILPACQSEDAGNDGATWTDEALTSLVQAVNTGLRDQSGYAGWQSGATGHGGQARTDYAHNAMRHAYNSLAEWIVEPTPQPTPALALPYNVSDNPAVWHCYKPDGSLDAWVIEPQFIKRYQALGDQALDIFGLPISGMYLDGDGRYAQWFERARMELHDGRVLLGLVGAEAMAASSRLNAEGFIPKVLARVAA